MSKMSDQSYLLEKQYKDASNLNARIQLHELFSTNKEGVHRWLFDYYDLPPQARVLELGCGPGTLWLKNLDRIPDGWDITLSDFSEGMLEDAKRNLGEKARRFKLQVIDAQAIPFADRSFDAVIANFMLYHVPDRSRAFSEVRRVLKPGGRFYAATLGENHLRELNHIISRFVNPESVSEGPVVGFSLENGAEQMAPWLPHVTLHRFDDSLVITEVEPLIAYIFSMQVGPSITGDKLEALIQYVTQEIARKGVIHVAKDSGLFEAIRGDA